MAENETTHGSMQQEMTLRDASIQDVETIAAWSAASWRRHYRGAYLVSFLDGDALTNRLAVWGARMRARARITSPSEPSKATRSSASFT